MFFIDKGLLACYNDNGESPSRHHYGGGRFPFSRESRFLFAFPMRGGDIMVSWEMLFLLAGFIISLLTYVDNHNKKK